MSVRFVSSVIDVITTDGESERIQFYCADNNSLNRQDTMYKITELAKQKLNEDEDSIFFERVAEVYQVSSRIIDAAEFYSVSSSKCY